MDKKKAKVRAPGNALPSLGHHRLRISDSFRISRFGFRNSTLVGPGPASVFLLALIFVLAVCGAAGAQDLTVSVADQNSTPFAGITVYAYTQAGAYTSHYAVTDDNGVAAFGDIGQFATDSHKFKAVYLGQDFWVENIDLPATTSVALAIATAPVDVTVNSAGQAAGNVKVYLFSEAGSYLSRNALTGADGRVAFVLPVNVAFKLRADILGSQYWSQPFNVASGANTVVVDAGGGHLSVTLQKDAAHPMAGIKLYLFNTAGSYLGQSMVTDAAGLGQFDVPEGTYRIRADYLGYQFWRNDTEVAADTDLVFAIPHKDVTITVNGQLDTPQAVTGAKVYLFTAAGSYVGLNQTSDADGKVQFSLPDQAYKVRADFMNLQFWSDPFQFQDFTLTIPMAEAEVSVVWGGAPLAGVPVYLFTATDTYTGIHLDTGADGIALFQMPAAAWKFRADYQTNQYWTAATDLPAGVRTPVELSTGGGTMTFGVTLYKDDGEPLEGVNCYVFNAGGSYTGISGATNSQGEVYFDLAAGQYQIRVDYLGYQFWSELYDVSAATSDVFHIPHQDITVTVNGLFDTPQPLPDLPVYLFTETGQYLSQTLTTDAAGQVTFTLPDKAFKVRVDYLGQQVWSQPFTGQNSSVDIPMAEAQVSVTGAGHGLQDVTVYVFSQDESYLNLNGVTDANGRVDFRLPAGTYLFRTSYLGHTFWSDPTTLAAQAAQPVAIAAGGGTFGFTLLKSPTEALASTKCYLFNGTADQYLNLWGTTDENGQLNFELVAGDYTIRVDYLGYQIFTDAFQVPETLSQVFTIPHVQVPVTVNGVLGAAAPLEGVKVYLFTGAGAYQNQNQTTAADGQVYFSLPAGDYKVRADYLNQQYWSPVFNQAPATVNIPMARAQVGVQGAGEPLEGVNVYVFTGSGSYVGRNAATDAQGLSTFVLPAQEFKFRADYQGSQFWSDAVTLASGQLNNITIDTGGGTLKLRVEKDAYHPLEGLNSYVYSAAGSYLGLFGTTDSQGRVNFKLADGQYKLKLKYAGYDFWTDPLTITQDLAHTFTIPHLRRDLYVQGINPGPEPLQDLTAYVYTGGGSYISLSASTDAGGHAAFDLPQEDYKVKVVYNGQNYWSQILQPSANLITINRDGSAVLPAVESFSATLNAADQIDLSWTAPADTGGLTISGYNIYRRRPCQAAFERINSALIPADAAAYTDAQVSPPDNYTYYIAAVSDTGVEGYPGPMAAAGFAGAVTETNTAGINNLTAAWQQGQAGLAWDAQPGCTYQIFRGAAADALVPWQRSDAAAYLDPGANPYQTWYFQVATVKTVCDPAGGQPVELVGPPSAVVTLAGLSAPVATTTDLTKNADGEFVITTGAGQSYLLQGSYSGLNGDVTVTAVLGAQTVTGTGADGQFSIELTSAGDWQITIRETGGWQSTTIDTTWQIDAQPPSLTVDGPAARSTSDSAIDISGTAHDSQSSVLSVRIESDRYPGTPFGTSLGALGSFSGQVPLKAGDNQLTVIAEDVHNNSASQNISVTQTLTALPIVKITAPADGATVLSNRIDVSGTVTSSLPPEQIRLVLADQVDFPAGSNNDYTFTFSGVSLVEGANVLTVRAETSYGTVTAQITVNYTTQATGGQIAPPQIEVHSPLPDTYLSGKPEVSGLVRSELGVKAVSVNGQPADATGLGTGYASFQAALDFAAGQQDLTIDITATDLADQDSTLSYTVYQDGTAPLIVLQNGSLQAPPAVNTTTASPYPVAGTITEANLGGAAINGQAIALAPGVQADTYTFSAGLPLTYGSDQSVTVEAWDLAGNRTSTEWLVRLDSNLTIEVIAPRDGAELQGQGTQTAVAVTARVSGAQAGDVFKAAVDGAALQLMVRSGTVGNITFSVPTVQAEHSLTVQVENSGGTVLSATTTGFTLRNMDDVPLAVEKIKPANGASGIEPNDFIALYFNKAVDPALLQIEVLETAHGKTYGALASGADITQLTRVELVEVERDRELVPGGVSHFPANHMAAFYPARDLAYGGTVYVNATYDGQEVARAVFKVRPLPTFIEGTVQDTVRLGLAGIQVAIPELGLTTTTDRDGGFGFGFQMPADQNLPGGRFKVVANPKMADRNYGIIEQWVNVTQGRLNSMAVMLLPSLNPNIPFRRIVSGNAQTVLAGGALTLDLSAATLTFPDLRDQGDVHVQLLNIDEISHKPLASLTPYWMFAVQPAGVEVAGKVGLAIGVPTQNGTYTYVQGRGKYYILLGLDPVSLMMVPVGLAEFDYDNRRMVSLEPVALKRLDYLGFALAPGEAYPFIEQCAKGEISFGQMVALIENLR